LFPSWPHFTALALLDATLVAVFIPWILLTKRDSTIAVAWCLTVLFMPLLGALLFWVFGCNPVRRYLSHKQAHRLRFQQSHPPRHRQAARGKGDGGPAADDAAHQLDRLALAVNAFPPSPGNAVTLFHDTGRAFDALLDALRAARHHVHLEYFIVRSDATGRRLFDLLAEKARAGVEVRLLYDSWGGLFLRRRLLRPLIQAGGRVATFLPVNPLRSRIRINLRNHRKLTVVDGRTGFTGGMNIGDEYLGLSPRFGYWRDTFLRLEGPAVAGLQRVFVEDWDFAAREALDGDAYFPRPEEAGAATVQVVESSAGQEPNSIREIYFAAILAARQRVWVASPYFVPDSGLLDALRLACYRGVDVRLLTLSRPDHFLPFYASHYYWTDMLAAGVRIYLYTRGMMHAKLMLVDGEWALVGSANLDNRSLHLNFEAGCMLYTPSLVAALEEQFRKDLDDSGPLEAATFARRPFAVRLAENACRLFSPIL
jgi:cardiolipin synthase